MHKKLNKLKKNIGFPYRKNQKPRKSNTIFLVAFLICHVMMSATSPFLEIVAEQREFEVEIFEENITIPTNEIRSIYFNLKKGVEFDVIYTLVVKQNLVCLYSITL